MGPYTASKAGVEALTDALRVELSTTGARAGCAYFGFIDTDLVRASFAQSSTQTLQSNMPGFIRKPVPVGKAVDAIERAVDKRLARTWAPRFVGGFLALRGILQPLAEKRLMGSPSWRRRSPRPTPRAAPRAERRRGSARQLIEQVDEGGVRLARRLRQPDLAGPVAADVRVEEPARESAASSAVADAVSSGCSIPRSPAKPQHVAAAGTTTSSAIAAMTSCSGCSSPSRRAEHVGWTATDATCRFTSSAGSSRCTHSIVTRPLDCGVRPLSPEAVGARVRVDNHRQLAAVGPALDRATVRAHRLLGGGVALRAERHAAAVAGDVVGDPDRHPGAGAHAHERLGSDGPKMRLMQAGR